MIEPGNNSWKLFYHPIVIKRDIKILDSVSSRRVRNAIEQRLIIDPLHYGSPLHGTLEKFFKLRVGDWRVIYSISKNEVHILLIAHRKEVYKMASSRLI